MAEHSTIHTGQYSGRQDMNSNSDCEYAPSYLQSSVDSCGGWGQKERSLPEFMANREWKQACKAPAAPGATALPQGLEPGHTQDDTGSVPKPPNASHTGSPGRCSLSSHPAFSLCRCILEVPSHQQITCALSCRVSQVSLEKLNQQKKHTV